MIVRYFLYFCSNIIERDMCSAFIKFKKLQKYKNQAAKKRDTFVCAREIQHVETYGQNVDALVWAGEILF